MAVIFYGVSGEGMGHATRSAAVIKRLIKKHKIFIFSYSRAFDFLEQAFRQEKNIIGFQRITGINFVYEKNAFRIDRTVIKESKKIPSFLFRNSYIFTKAILKYNPNLIITDFEPISNSIAKLLNIPLICIDNINFIAKCDIDKRFKKSISNKFVEYILNFNGTFNFIITVFDIPLKNRYKKNTMLIGPVLRDYFKTLKGRQNDFILVYQTSTSNDKLFNVLKQTKEHYIVYGFNRSGRDKNLLFKKPCQKGFVNDLAQCKGVITNGGFSLITEAVFMKKPIYSVPVKHQIEQEVNGFYIEQSGYGHTSKETNVKDLEYFLSNLKVYRENLSKKSFSYEEPFKQIEAKVDSIASSYKPDSRIRILKKISRRYDYYAKHLMDTILIKKPLKLILSPDYNIKKDYMLSKLQEKNNSAASIKIKERRLKKISYTVMEFKFNNDAFTNIVMLHGLGGNQAVFLDTIMRLVSLLKTRNVRFITIDLAGHGKSGNFESVKEYAIPSQSKIVVSIIKKEIGKEKFNLLGHCLGSFIAVHTAALIPERIDKLFLISSNPFPADTLSFRIIRSTLIQKSLHTLFNALALTEEGDDIDYSRFRNTPDYDIHRIFTDIKNTSLKSYFASLYALSQFSPQDFKKIAGKIKIIMIHGTKDRVFPYSEIKQKVKKLDVKLISLNSNHIPVINSVPALARAIARELA